MANKKTTRYIVGYTVNGKDLGIRSWYMDSVWAILPSGTEDTKINVFKNFKVAEKYYKKFTNDLRSNLKKEWQGGKVWIRKTGSSQNPFKLEPFTDRDFAYEDWIKVGFSPKKVLT